MEDLLGKPWFIYVLAGSSGYLLGSVSYARIVTRIFGRKKEVQRIERDIPDTDIVLESDSVAATAVTLELGKRYGCLTAILDMVKAALITWIFHFYFPDGRYFLLAALGCMAGHNYPIWHRFKGGRGQAPLLGSLLIINWFGVLIANMAAVVLGYLTGAVLVMRWGWMVIIIAWFGIWYQDPWYVLYAMASNFLFFFSMRKEMATGIRIGRNRTSTQEEVSEFMLMGKKFGRFIDNYGFPALMRKLFNKIRN